MTIAPRPAAANLALEHHHKIRVEAKHTVKALIVLGVGDVFGELERLCVRGQEDTHQASPLHRAVRQVFLGGIDQVGGLHVHDAVRQLALRGLADRTQQRLARQRHQP